MSAGPPAPILSQPQWNNDSKLPKQTAVVPPGLECLVEVEEVILRKEVFKTTDDKELFIIRHASECCGPAINLSFLNSSKTAVLHLLLQSGGLFCEGETDMKISTDQVIGLVNISSVAGSLSVSIQRGNQEPIFKAWVPRSLDCSGEYNLEISCVNGSQPVAQIIRIWEGNTSLVTFRFPLNLEAALKAIILGAYLYMRLRMRDMSPCNSIRDEDDTAGGMLSSEEYQLHHYSYHDNDSGNWGHNHDDFGEQDGDCGGGVWAGEGDCGSGGGNCGSGGGDCGSGGGDCGSGGGDCGGGDCGDGGAD